MSNWNPNYGDKPQYKKTNRYKLEDGNVVFRILPPPDFETNGSGDWSKYYAVHFGYKNSEGKARPFASPQVVKTDKITKTKQVLVEDAAMNRFQELEQSLAKAKLEGNTALATKLTSLVGFKGTYSVDKNHHMNVIGLDGNIGVLKIRYKAKLALDALIKELRAKGVDPLSFNDGRYFVFTRSGTNQDTIFNVSVYQEEVDVPNFGKMKRDLVHVVTPEIISRLKTDGVKLDEIAVQLSSNEVAKIVETSDLMTGKSPVCDEVFKAYRERLKSAGLQAPSSEDDVDMPKTTTSKTTTPTTVVTPIAGTSTTSATTVTTPTQSVTTPTQSVPTPDQSLDDLSDDDFLAMIKKGGDNTAASA